MNANDTFEAGLELLRDLGGESVRHSRGTLIGHLVATHNLLRDWGAPESLCLAGLFHSVYGTEGFPIQIAPLAARDVIRKTIGPEAEAIAWAFGMCTNKSFWHVVSLLSSSGTAEAEYVLTNRISGDGLICPKERFLSIVNLTLANALEQAERLPERYATPSKRKTLNLLLNHSLSGAVLTFQKIYGSTFAQCG